ncbi:MAG: hypothetical protein ACOXZS_01945 [Bacilli bacterium]
MDEIYQKKREVLALDPIKIYEDKFGKKCHEWTFRDIYFFSKLATEVNLYKNFCLWKFGDTYRDMPWHDFLKTCRQYGFEAAYRSPSYVIDFDTWVIDELESQIILYHKERGLILFAQSVFDGDKLYVDSARVYGEIYYDDSQHSSEEREVLFLCNVAATDYNTLQFSIDASEAMIYKLDNIGLYFNFINPWNIYPHIWFLNRDGTDEDLYVNDSRMEDMGVEVQKIMRYVPKGSVKKLYL